MKRILIAPLNWGLGHAARCIPIVNALLEMDAAVTLASDGAALQLLKSEFPALPAVELPSYNIRYTHENMVHNMAFQLPRILYAIRAEKWAIERLVRERGIQGIVSDNRYGCFSHRAQSVMLSHQLHIRVPNRALEWFVGHLNKLALSRFDAVWTPDLAGVPNLSAALSHGDQMHVQHQFCGILTRMQCLKRDKEYDFAVVLSGPEPQRSLLEARLLEQAISLPYKCIFVQGKPQSMKHYFASDNVEVVSYLTSKELNEVLMASDAVVCRSGYSSIMDLAVLGKKAILIPTPGQTEQEYLGEIFSAENIFVQQRQSNINLESGMEALAGTSGIPAGQFSSDTFRPILAAWVAAL